MSHLTDTLHDLTDYEVVKDCNHELQKAEAAGEAAMAAWARTWGRAALVVLSRNRGSNFTRPMISER